MRISLRPILSLAPMASAWTISLVAFVCNAAIRIAELFREAFDMSAAYLPKLESMPHPVRRILMLATALNGRQVGGVRIRGFLGRPTVRMLTG